MKRLLGGIFLFLSCLSSYSQTGWIKSNSNTSELLTGVYCVSPSKIWAVGGSRDEDPYIGKVIRSTDQGINWYSQKNITSRYLRDVFFDDENEGWAVGYNGIIIHTTNGGSSWQTFQLDSAFTLFSVFFINDNIGWACGTEASIIKTVNGGQSWQLMNTEFVRNPSTGRKPKLRSIYFIDSKDGWAVGHDRWILKTVDGGTTWKVQYSLEADEDLRYVQFFNSNVGYAIGERGIIIKTTNGGQSWQHLNSGTSNDLWGGYFLDQNTGWAVGDNGTVVKTINGGQQWYKQSTGTNRDLQAIMFANDEKGWIVGEDGLVLRTTTGGDLGTEPPYFTSDDAVSVTEGTLLSYTATAVDPSGYQLILSYTEIPSWMSVNGTIISGTPASTDLDTSFTITASNGIQEIEQKVQITIIHPNYPPRLVSPTHVTATEDVPFAYIVQSLDVNGDDVDVAIQNLPDWITQQGMTLMGTPREGDGNTGFYLMEQR